MSQESSLVKEACSLLVAVSPQTKGGDIITMIYLVYLLFPSLILAIFVAAFR